VMAVLILGCAVYVQISKARKRHSLLRILQRIPGFHSTRQFFSDDGITGIALDENSRRACLLRTYVGSISGSYRLVSFSELVDAQIVADERVTGRRGELAYAASQPGRLIAVPLTLARIASGEVTANTRRIRRIDVRITLKGTQDPIHTLNFMSDVDRRDNALFCQQAMASAIEWRDLLNTLIQESGGHGKQ